MSSKDARQTMSSKDTRTMSSKDTRTSLKEVVENNFIDAKIYCDNKTDQIVFRAKYKGFDCGIKLFADINDENFISEVKILKFFMKNPHPNIICCTDIVFVETYCLVIMPQCYDFMGSLRMHEKNNAAQLHEYAMIRSIRNIVSGIRHIHSLDICHLDLKANNILLRADNGASYETIIDFGSSAFVGMQVFEKGNKFEYVYYPPEYHCSDVTRYAEKSVDIWGLGILLLEIITKKAAPNIIPMIPFVSAQYSFNIGIIHRLSVTPLSSLISKCLSFEQENRPTIHQVHRAVNKMHSKLRRMHRRKIYVHKPIFIPSILH